ncbi:hypothetical protein MKX03_009573 [Papaver bracteatum]|nr:hypothetical protein MKX03_009573 [Papaver bracteatum]
MGRNKIEIEKINDPTKRMITFSKRRGGIQSKAAELCKLFPDITVSIIVFSPGGKAFTFSNSPLGVCNMVQRFLEEQKLSARKEELIASSLSSSPSSSITNEDCIIEEDRIVEDAATEKHDDAANLDLSLGW